MRIIITIFTLLVFSSMSYAQNRLVMYIDSLSVEEVTATPPLYRVPIRARNFANVGGFDYRMSISSEIGAKIVGIEYVGPIADVFNSFGIQAPDSTSFTWLLVGATEDVTVPFDTIIAYLLIGGEMDESGVDFDCNSLEVITGGNENVVIPSTCVSANDVRYRPFRTLVGTIKTIEDDSLGDVIVRLTVDGEEFMQDTTGADGQYLFEDVPTFGNYTLSVVGKLNPETRSQRIRGVNIADLVLMARDLVGSDTLANPYAVLAFDVSGDGDAGIEDLVQVQSYVLARTDSYGDAPYYRFYSEGSTPAETVSFEESIPEDTTTNFIIIKMGDVNFSSFR